MVHASIALEDTYLWTLGLISGGAARCKGRLRSGRGRSWAICTSKGEGVGLMKGKAWELGRMKEKGFMYIQNG